MQIHKHEQSETLIKKDKFHMEQTRKPYKEKTKETKCRYCGKLHVFKKEFYAQPTA